MKLDPAKLKADADAHAVRQQSELWARDDGQPDETWTAPLAAGAHAPDLPSSRAPTSESGPRPWPVAREPSPEGAGLEILPRLDALDQAVERLSAMVARRPVGSEGVPGWLEAAAGDPHTYDAPDASRTGVCVRLLPATYAQLQQTQRRLGLRTIAGAWEFLVRLGLAAAERLPAR